MLDAAPRSPEFLDRVGEGILALDAEWRVTYLNRAAERLLSRLVGVPASSLHQAALWAHNPSFSDSPLAHALRDAFVSQRTTTQELYDPAAATWLEARAYPSRGGVTVLLRDITTQKAALSTTGGESLLDGMRDVFIACDHAWRVTYVNARADHYLALVRLRRDDVVGRELWSAIPALAGTRFQAEAFRAVAEHGEVEFQELFVPLNRWFTVRIAATGEGIIASARDVTQRLQTERELERWARIFEHAGWGVAILSLDGRTIEAVNPAFARMHGWTAEELAGQRMALLCAPNRRAERARMEAVLREQGHRIWESEHLHRDGSVFPVLIDATVVKDSEGQMLYQAMNVQDLTERKRAEDQVRQAQKMEAVGRLAGGVAHDFNNMMMIVLGFSDFLLTSLERTDPRWGDADEIRKAAERAMHLTRQLLSFGRHQLIARQVLSLNDVIAGMERMLRPLLGEDIRLETCLSPGLGGVEADYGQLEQVIMNLTLNARDAMRGGGRLTIETLDADLPQGYGYHHVGIEIPAGPYVMLRVSDTGHGMTPEVKARLFEPFFTTKSTERNTGLGLATVYGIVVQSGGYIWVDSEPGRGTTFTICFPRAVSEDPAPPLIGTPAVPAGGSEVVLVVEDEDAVRGLARRVLMNQGYTVLEASNGREALDMVRGAHPPIDLVLTDVVMPELGGQEMVQELLEAQPDLRVIYMSGYTESDKLLPAIQDSPYHSFLQKPFSPESLVLKIREVLDRGASLAD